MSKFVLEDFLFALKDVLRTILDIAFLVLPILFWSFFFRIPDSYNFNNIPDHEFSLNCDYFYLFFSLHLFIYYRNIFLKIFHIIFYGLLILLIHALSNMGSLR